MPKLKDILHTCLNTKNPNTIAHEAYLLTKFTYSKHYTKAMKKAIANRFIISPSDLVPSDSPKLEKIANSTDPMSNKKTRTKIFFSTKDKFLKTYAVMHQIEKFKHPKKHNQDNPSLLDLNMLGIALSGDNDSKTNPYRMITIEVNGHNNITNIDDSQVLDRSTIIKAVETMISTFDKTIYSRQAKRTNKHLHQLIKKSLAKGYNRRILAEQLIVNIFTDRLSLDINPNAYCDVDINKINSYKVVINDIDTLKDFIESNRKSFTFIKHARIPNPYSKNGHHTIDKSTTVTVDYSTMLELMAKQLIKDNEKTSGEKGNGDNAPLEDGIMDKLWNINDDIDSIYYFMKHKDSIWVKDYLSSDVNSGIFYAPLKAYKAKADKYRLDKYGMLDTIANYPRVLVFIFHCNYN